MVYRDLRWFYKLGQGILAFLGHKFLEHYVFTQPLRYGQNVILMFNLENKILTVIFHIC